MLHTHEMRLESLNSSTLIKLSPSTANFAPKFSSQTPVSHGGQFSYNNLNKTLCQICSKIGHTTLKCLSRYDLRYQS